MKPSARAALAARPALVAAWAARLAPLALMVACAHTVPAGEGTTAGGGAAGRSTAGGAADSLSANAGVAADSLHVDASGGRPALRALAAGDISLDASPAARVLAIWARGDRRPEAARGVASGLAYRTIQQNLAQQSGCPTTRLELERALANPDSGICGFGLHPAWRARASIDSLVRAIRADSPGIAARLARRAGAYLPPAALRPIRYQFLLASQYTFDALTIDAPADGDSAPVVIVNLTDVLAYAGNTAGRMAALEHILAHEAFHAVLHQIRGAAPGWREYLPGGLAAERHIAQVMVDEGVAHYVDWKDRPGSDTLFTARPGDRERFAFSQLALACRRLRESRPGAAQWWETLQLASSGPLWSKYGAVSGMFAAFRIERVAGREALVRAIQAGPPEFLRRYGEAAAADTSLRPLPGDLANLE